MIGDLLFILVMLISFTAAGFGGYIKGHRDGYQEGKTRGFAMGTRSSR